jgi:hypothetical protein
LIGCFLEADAVRPDHALSYAPARPIDQRALERLVDRGVIRAAGDGGYYLDLQAYHAFHAELLQRASLLAVFSLAIAGILALLAALGFLRLS